MIENQTAAELEAQLREALATVARLERQLARAQRLAAMTEPPLERALYDRGRPIGPPHMKMIL